MQYKTPGVYVEEISKFPPSVAEVATAIPAFIGYTQKAQKLVPGDLDGVPTKVRSLLEYEEFFGFGPSMQVTAVNIDENNVLTGSDMSRANYLYDSIRMFYANGGGNCYIVSIGSYEDPNVQGDYTDALTTLEKYDEPTLILFPDAIGLGTNLYNVQRDAIAHCAKMQDRFTVLDLIENRDDDIAFDWETGVQEFRDNIGINDLKYAAAYTPHLISNLGITLNYRDIRDRVFRGGILVDLATLTDSTDAQTILTNLNNAIDDNDRITGEVSSLGANGVREEFLSLVDTFRNTNNEGTATANFRAVIDYIYNIIDTIDSWVPGPGNTPVDNSDLVTDTINLITDSLGTSVSNLVAFDKGANSELTAAYNRFADPIFTFNATEWGDTFNPANPPGPEPNIIPFTGANDPERRLNSLSTLLDLFEQIYTAFASLTVASRNYESEGEEALFNTHVVYRSLITELRNSTTVLPPSGAMVGVYAKTDNDRGVFKAPANVSVNGAIGLSYAIDQPEQDELNVNTVSGKSINAIRTFTGKGILVWGSRTLAGNDNEWRYVPVRRFFIFAEESIKKATEPFVFEPNDANTWTKIKSMISNFLTLQWRAGALAGANPDQAFFVKIGLGETMTALDILEGRMIIEIGMAVVRPAEFIILKFSHKMQES
ncbi:phage tail sheath family protein [Aquimarina algiphila]|nr:phage tail sheath C-terminal domain-containing protein [Aquimarina algiphila]